MTKQHYVIVIAEDDRSINALLCDVLDDAGYTVASCVSGAEAYQMATRLEADVVVTDLHMEEPDAGLRLLERLRADPATARVGVIVCSADGYALHRNSQHARELGAALMPKPFDLDGLLQTVQQFYDGR